MVTIVIGGAGFIGSNLCKRLLNLGHQVICFDNLIKLGFMPNFFITFSEANFTYTHTWSIILLVMDANAPQ